MAEGPIRGQHPPMAGASVTTTLLITVGRIALSLTVPLPRMPRVACLRAWTALLPQLAEARRT
eukprot:7186596-Alexandrium_andersonii.AAC.1